MLTELLTPKGEKEIKQKIEVLEESNNCDEDEEEDVEDIDFYFEQTLPSEEREELTGRKADGYGFAFEHHNVYKSLMAEYGEILDVKDPDSLSQIERDNMRKEKENGDFSSDHYLCDLYDSVEEIQACLEQEAPFRSCVTGEADLSSRLTVNILQPSGSDVSSATTCSPCSGLSRQAFVLAAISWLILSMSAWPNLSLLSMTLMAAR